MKKMLILLCAMLVLSACQTVEGFGRDVQKVGNKMEDAARK